MDFQRLPMLPLEAKEKIEAIRFLEYGKKIKMVETHVTGIEIDTPEDLERANKAWK
jgi:3-deoxy-manno-octulosonate cytidylyltransferase (CMP-KDO synthetase)